MPTQCQPYTNLRTILATVFVIASLASAPSTWACDKKGHDCRARTGRASIRELPFRVALNQGLFAKEGVHPELVFNDDTARLSSVLDGTSLIAVASPFELPPLLEKDRRVKIIGVLQDKPRGFLVSREKKDLRALKGQIFGVSTPTGSDAAFAKLAFSGVGFRPLTDYTLHPLSLPLERLSAISNGQISAAIFEAPFAFLAKERGLIATPLVDYISFAAETVIIGRQDELEREAKGVASLLAALRAAIDWTYDPKNQSAVLATLEKEYRLPTPHAAFVYDSLIRRKIYARDSTLSPDTQKWTNDWLRQVDVTLASDSFDMRYATRIKR